MRDTTSMSWQGSFCLAPADNCIRSFNQTYKERIPCAWPGTAEPMKLLALRTFSMEVPPSPCSIASPLETPLYSEPRGRAEDYRETRRPVLSPSGARCMNPIILELIITE